MERPPTALETPPKALVSPPTRPPPPLLVVVSDEAAALATAVDEESPPLTKRVSIPDAEIEILLHKTVEGEKRRNPQARLGAWFILG